MYIRNWLSHEGDCQDNDGRNPKKNNCKIQVVNPTDDERAVGRGHTATSSVDKLWYHSTKPGQQPNYQAPEGTLQKGTEVRKKGRAVTPEELLGETCRFDTLC